MTYEEWEKTVPAAITDDALWKMRVYRLALFAGDLGWHDVVKLAQDRRAVSLADQLYRALGSVSANIAEGYSRSSGRDQARMHEYALGSARETRDWYWKSRYILGEDIANHRIGLLAQIIRLLLVIVPSERARHIREELNDYAPAPAP
jgi:four helix bundle protein